jgi:hypothetical protein
MEGQGPSVRCSFSGTGGTELWAGVTRRERLCARDRVDGTDIVRLLTPNFFAWRHPSKTLKTMRSLFVKHAP